MKSSRCSDEIFGFASDEIKSTNPPPRRISSNAVGFHHEVIYSTRRVDLAEKDIFGSFAYDFELSHFFIGINIVENFYQFIHQFNTHSL